MLKTNKTLTYALIHYITLTFECVCAVVQFSILLLFHTHLKFSFSINHEYGNTSGLQRHKMMK